jgi:FtsP/CotA-like multicopper oxidase with cupredoxin domain
VALISAASPLGIQWKQIAQDGVQFHDDNYQQSLNKPFLLAAGNRADILVKAPPPGTYPVLVQHDVDPSDLRSASPVVLLQIRVRSDAPPATGPRAQFIPTAPKQPAFLTNITNEEVASTIANPRVIRFASTPPNFGGTPPSYAMHTINNQKFNENNDPIAVDLNTVEEWKIVNETYGPPVAHPFHIHINPFQIVEVFDPNATTVTARGRTVPKYVLTDPPFPDVQCRLDPQDQATWKDCHNKDSDTAPRIWWDVFPIPSGRTVPNANNPGQPVNIPGYFRMRSRFVDFGGRYVLHCHILAHEDRGMMAIVHVTRPGEAPESGLFKHH